MLQAKRDPNPLILIELDKPLPNTGSFRLRLSLPQYSLILLAGTFGFPVMPLLTRLLARWVGL